MIATKHITNERKIEMEQTRQSNTSNKSKMNTEDITKGELIDLLIADQIAKGRSVKFDKSEEGIKLEISLNESSADIEVPAEAMSGESIFNLCEKLDKQFPKKTPMEQMEKNKQELYDLLDWESGHVIAVRFSDEETEAEPLFLNQQQRNYIDAALADELYECENLKKHRTVNQGALVTDLVKTLIFDWLKYKGRKAFRNCGWGGNWSNGEYSGLWADICLELAVNEDFKGYCPHGRIFLGLRLQYEGTETINPLTLLLGGRRRSNFVVTHMTQMYEPSKKGKTTRMMPNYGEPHRWTVEVKFDKFRESELARLIEEEKQKKAEEKRIAHEAFLAEQRQREREWRARLEADLASTIVAYNAEEENLKKVIRFNRENVAEPRAKRIEAKEAERQREEAERRHAEKLAQKEKERLAKFAPKARK